MHSYAQTNIQLYDQLRRLEYSASDIAAVRRAYELTQPLMPGRFRPSGKPLQDHLVGTASILATSRASLKFLIVGLLHAVYAEGDFGLAGHFSSKARRHRIQEVLDAQTENLLAAYAAFPWNTQSILNAARDFDVLSAEKRDVLLLRLANDLEDNLDLAVLYCPNRDDRLNYLCRCGPAMVEMAQRLGFPELAKELRKSHAALLDCKSLEEFPFATEHKSSWERAPLSYRKRFLHATVAPLLYNSERVARKLKRIAQSGRS